MDSSILYKRIINLCENNGVPIAKLETDLGFSNGLIKKWRKTSSPSIDKVIKIATYFNVSVDYLVGLSDVTVSADMILQDKDYALLQKAKEQMSQENQEHMMQLIRVGFNMAINDNSGDEGGNNSNSENNDNADLLLEPADI